MIDLKSLSDSASPGPWAYRPERLDDWGEIRAPMPDGTEPGFVVASSRPLQDDRDFSKHRAAGTDPCEANGAFITALVNAFRAGELTYTPKGENHAE